MPELQSGLVAPGLAPANCDSLYQREPAIASAGLRHE